MPDYAQNERFRKSSEKKVAGFRKKYARENWKDKSETMRQLGEWLVDTHGDTFVDLDVMLRIVSTVDIPDLDVAAQRSARHVPHLLGAAGPNGRTSANRTRLKRYR